MNTNLISYNDALLSRKCWYKDCKCKSKLPPIGEGRKNGKDGKIEYGGRRFHTKCDNEYKRSIDFDMYSLSYTNPKATDQEQIEYRKKWETLRLKPEYRHLQPEYYERLKKARQAQYKKYKKY